MIKFSMAFSIVLLALGSQLQAAATTSAANPSGKPTLMEKVSVEISVVALDHFHEGQSYHANGDHRMISHIDGDVKIRIFVSGKLYATETAKLSVKLNSPVNSASALGHCGDLAIRALKNNKASYTISAAQIPWSYLYHNLADSSSGAGLKSSLQALRLRDKISIPADQFKLICQ